MKVEKQTMLKRITKASVKQLLVSWNPRLQSQIEEELVKEPPFMTVQRVANIADVSESTVRRYINRGDLTAITTEGPNSAQGEE
jgi:hypothetical protein